ncbi:MAG: glycosyl transferase [Candidatus Tectimicrobiota bacterium]|nr:MAG: glycosyl transferase [Candidatus Tectomicrobia bacterium]
MRADAVAQDAPLVSVLLPVWNAAATLLACLRSLQRQRERRWECVLVDDGSCDASLAVARRVAAREPRLKVLATPHRGLVAALQTGLNHCRGRFVARMDADDLMHRERLALQSQWLLSHPELAAVGCHVRLFPRRFLRAGRRAYERWLNSIDSPQRVRQEAFVECPVAHPTLMVRREILLAFGYRDCGWPEDYDLLLRLLTSGLHVGMVPRRLLLWRDTPQRLSRTSPTYALSRFTACKAAFLAASFLAGRDTYILWGFGETGKALHRALRAHGKRPAYIVELHPRRLGKTIHGAAVIPPDALPRVARLPLVVSVAGAAARTEIRQALAQMGFVETRDFVCAA